MNYSIMFIVKVLIQSLLTLLYTVLKLCHYKNGSKYTANTARQTCKTLQSAILLQICLCDVCNKTDPDRSGPHIALTFVMGRP